MKITNMHTCSSCKHWTERTPMDVGGEWLGTCPEIVIRNWAGYPGLFVPRVGKKGIRIDGLSCADSEPQILTGPEFGCVFHEPKMSSATTKMDEIKRELFGHNWESDSCEKY